MHQFLLDCSIISLDLKKNSNTQNHNFCSLHLKQEFKIHSSNVPQIYTSDVIYILLREPNKNPNHN